MAKKKHGEPHEEHADESWLIPYADLLTLLLALFIVLFATSTASTEKLQAMAAAFSSIVYGDGGANSALIDTGAQGTEGDQIAIIPMQQSTPAPSDTEGDEGGDGGKAQIEQLESNFKTYVAENNLSDQMQVEGKDDGLLITLTSDVWFPSGSADIGPQQTIFANEVGAMIAESQAGGQTLGVVVSGHTDNEPIHTAQYNSNWELSVARAVNFMKILISTTSLNPSNFSARGLGEYEPIDTNDTPEGRQHNRRVEVFVKPDASVVKS